MTAPTKWDINRIWDRFTAPSAAIEDFEQQRQARVLASLLVIAIPLNLIGMMVVHSLYVDQTSDLVSMFILLVVAYGFSRTRYIALSSLLAIGVFAGLPFLMVLNRQAIDPHLANEYLIWLAIPILISGMVRPLQRTILVSSMIALGLFVIILLMPTLTFEKNGSVFGFIWTAAMLVILLATVYYQSMDQLRNQLVERQRIEEKLRASVAEKEVLLREIHHRVKNNLQIISSLLSLQASHVTHADTVAMIHDSQHRIRSMALVHEQLYRSSDLAQIDFPAYVQQLVAHLQYAYVQSDIQLTTHLDSAFSDLDTALSCGLIVNELVSNALKHAFPDGRSGEVQIKFQIGNPGPHILVIQDDGIGIPEDLDLQTTDSLGLQLVNSLVHQLEGTLELSAVAGTTFTIRFIAPNIHRGNPDNG